MKPGGNCAIWLVGRCFSRDRLRHAGLLRLGRSNGRRKLRGRFPKPQLGFAAGLQSQIHFSTGEIPAEELLDRVVVAAAVEHAEESGAGQAPRSEVEAEVDQGVELALGQSHLDQTANGELSRGDIAGQDGAGLRFADAARKRLGRHYAMAVADGGKTGHIGILLAAKPLEPLDQFQSFCT